MVQIFVSYRRDDADFQAHSLCAKLRQTFGAKSVFIDVDTIPPGMDFRRHLRERVDECDVMLAVIGDRWIHVQDENGTRRLENPADFVRIEIEQALKRDIPVIPLVFGRASVPKESELPEAIRDLAYRQAVVVRSGRDFDAEIERLIPWLKGFQSSSRTAQQASRDNLVSEHLVSEPRGAVLFLIDQSYSMVERTASGNSQGEVVANGINQWLDELSSATNEEAVFRDRLDIGIIGYRTDADANQIIEDELENLQMSKPDSARDGLVSLQAISKNPLREERQSRLFFDTNANKWVRRKALSKIWLEPKAEGGTPTCSALHLAFEVLDNWIEKHPNGIPPFVVNIFDGDCVEGDPTPYFDAVKSLETKQGNVLLFNCHLTANSQASSVLFPASAATLTDEFAQLMYHNSSSLSIGPSHPTDRVALPVPTNSRAFVFNGSAPDLSTFLQVVRAVLSAFLQGKYPRA